MELFESDIIANGVKLHVYRTGTNRRPLVFAHGRSDNGLCFWPFAQQLAGDYEVILFDARHHGQSEKPQGNTSLMDRAQDLAGLIDVLELRKPHLVGHSLGAVTVALLAGAYPHIPGCVVLEDPPPLALMAADDEQAMIHHREHEQSAATMKEKSVQELVEMNRRDNPSWPEGEREPWAQAKRQYQAESFDDDKIDAAAGERIVSQITCPLLLITADLDQGALFPPQAADELVSKLPNARHVNIPGAGHNIRRERPEAFFTTVRDFLRTCGP